MRNFLIIILSFLVLPACRDDRQKDFFLSDGSIKIRRYDRLQFEASVLNSVSAMQKMNMDFPNATKILIEDVLVLGTVEGEDINGRLCKYYSDSSLVNLMIDVEEKYKDLSFYEEKLTDVFKKLKKEIPSFVVPVVYSQISALNQSVIVADSLLGISLDKYMGEDYPMYKKYYYGYQRKSMTSERILPDCISFYLSSLYPFAWEDNYRTLFDVMMYKAKIAWITEKVLDVKKLGSCALGYTKKEFDWCKENKKHILSNIEKSGHLDSTDPMIIRSYVLPLPNYILKDSAPFMVGVWIGMQYIDEYMSENSDVTIEQLLLKTDYRKMLKGIKID